ncbi:MAG: MFS transporter [Phenylobacterium sp.]|nr:MFS transporter [Phenylobacterium sp.]
MSQVKQAPAGGRLSLSASLAFAAISLPLAALGLSVGVQLPPYFASQLGVSLAVVGGAFGLVRLMDIWLDPVIGLGMDRTRTRFGRYRVWMMAGAPVLIVSVYMLYNAPKGATLAYLVIWLLAMYLGQSIMGLSHSAWAAVLAKTYEQRSKIFGILTAVGVIGSLTALAIPILLEQTGVKDVNPIQAIGWFVMVMIPITLLIVVIPTPETISPDDGAHFKFSDYARLFARGNVIRVLAADLFVTLGPGWMAALYMFFFMNSRGFTQTGASLLLMVYIVAGFVGAPLTAALANRISKHRALMLTTTLYSVGLGLLLFLPKGNFAWFVPAMAIEGALAAGFGVMIRAITADIGDELRLEGGREQIGLLYSLTAATSKLAGAFSIALTFNLLALFGYDPRGGAANTPEQLLVLDLAFIIGPIIFVMLAGACFIGYKLDAKTHAEIRRQLDERDGVSVNYDEAAVLEGLTAEPGQATVDRR